MSDTGTNVNNLEVLQNSIDFAILQSKSKGIPYCQAGVPSAVDEYILEVQNQLGGNGNFEEAQKKMRIKYSCDCLDCSS